MESRASVSEAHNPRRTGVTQADIHNTDSKKDKPTPPPGHLVITIHSDDAGGPPKTIHGGPGEKISKMVEAAYAALGTTPKAGDRLTCVATGEDVKQYGEMHLRQYASGLCSDLIWTFARETGGAGV